MQQSEKGLFKKSCWTSVRTTFMAFKLDLHSSPAPQFSSRLENHQTWFSASMEEADQVWNSSNSLILKASSLWDLSQSFLENLCSQVIVIIWPDSELKSPTSRSFVENNQEKLFNITVAYINRCGKQKTGQNVKGRHGNEMFIGVFEKLWRIVENLDGHTHK